MKFHHDGLERSDAHRVIREFLFKSQTYKCWNDEISKVIVGLEVEYFIVAKDDARKVFKKVDFEKLLTILEAHGYSREYAKNKGECRASKDASPGFIVIEPDYGFHVLEIALPPRSDPQELKGLVKMVFNEVDQALSCLGFRRSERSVFDDLPTDWQAVNTARLHGFADTLRNTRAQHERTAFTDPYFGSKLAATHVHLNTGSEAAIAGLPLLFELEWLALKLFSHKESWFGVQCGSARALIYRDTFPATYSLCHVPPIIAKSPSELYDQYLNSFPPLFDLDPPFGVKDMSVIRIRPFGSIEFRSADSYLDVESLLGICAFRILQTLYAQKFQNAYLSSDQTWQAKVVFAAAEGIEADGDHRELMDKSFHRLKSCLAIMPTQWRNCLESSLGPRLLELETIK